MEQDRRGSRKVARTGALGVQCLNGVRAVYDSLRPFFNEPKVAATGSIGVLALRLESA